ncbi:helix-turn-helix domain-containing protein [Streptomyces sp. NPDC050161]|uniref:helix-turn-helix domain-containing protein n=1 Tax=Streptomyces TaxID=1883 RepID=UPI001D073A12|nr:helix-turn-helix transcriptional regulator [Streptomyces pinistramenti]MCB5911465.1 helix-turn-helix transcriptional regulator [Streptomyces pinistramenti]
MPPRKDTDASVSVPCFYGAELRFQREQAGLTLEQLVEGSFRGLSFLSQIERGERGMPKDLAVHVDKKLGTNGFFERHCTAVQKARLVGHPTYFASIPELEKSAATIEEWAPFLVPGLLQTKAYATKIAKSAAWWVSPETIEKRVRARMARAEFWKQPDRATFWAVLDESLVRRPLLTPKEMAEQLEHIAQVMRSSKGVVQILPESEGDHTLMMGLLRIMTFPDAPPLVYMEGDHSGQTIDYPPLVRDYRRSYDLLRAAALSPTASLARIEKAAEEFRNGSHNTRLE